MSRPRTPFGGRQAGTVPATMLKVLAAELSDGGRLTRGRALHRDRAVVDLDVSERLVTAQVQGSRARPYVVTAQLVGGPGTGVPARSHLRLRCSCPDGADAPVRACKHALATLFALADEVAIDPELLGRWWGDPAHDAPDHVDGPSTDDPDHEHDTGDHDSGEDGTDEPDDDPLHDHPGFRVPDGLLVPLLPELTAFERPRVPDALVDRVLREAMAELGDLGGFGP